MKLVTFLIFSGILQIHAAVYSQSSFSLKEEGITVKDILHKIEKSSNYTIFYRQDQIDLKQKVTVFTENAPIESVMKQVLQDQPLTFEIMDDVIVIKPLKAEAAQPGTVSGTVTDDKGEPLIGASVMVKGTTAGVSTDVSGKFNLRIPGGSQTVTLIVKYIGFKQKELTARPGQTGVHIVLDPDAASLSEVVVIGYGAVKRRDLTGSVSSVKSEDIVRIPTGNAIEAIQGRVPGADIIGGSGEPGAGVNITIRGNRSIADRDKMADRNAPLYIIDGFQGGDISTINPNDIASIEVLKDASSTAIYGSQGANGVIIITTKKGAEGKAKVSYSGYYGVSHYDFPASRMGDDYIRLRREGGRAKGIWNSPADDPAIFNAFTGEVDSIQSGHWNDWVSLLVRDGIQQNHSVSVTGGSDKTKVFASAAYFDEDGMLRNSDYKRFSGRFNLDQVLSKWAKTGILSQITYSKRNQRYDPIGTATSMSPLGRAYDENGQIVLYPVEADRSKISPLADEKTDYTAANNTLATNVMVNGYLELTPIKGLTLRSNVGATLNSSRQGIFYDKQSLARYSVNSSLASSDQYFRRFFNWDNILTYTRDLGFHSFTLTGITSYIQNDSDETFGQGVNQLLSSQLFYNLGGTSGDAGARTLRSDYVGSNNMAYAGRLNYSFKGKYLLTASGRFDGSSRLSEGHRWDFFPSAAIGWNISQEEFMKRFPVINNLKLRASYGVAGNQSIQPYDTQSTLDFNSRITLGGNTQAPGYQFSGRVGNEGLGWEKSTSYDAGLDIGLWRDRITATLDLYKTKTSDILLPRPLPISTGMTQVYQNIAKTENNAIELSVSSQNVQGRNFKWSSTFTFSRNREKITELLYGKDILATSGIERNSLLLGHPVQSFYTYKKLGIWQSSEADEAATYKFNSVAFKPGDIKLQDLDGDHIISATDMTYIGSSVPKWFTGLQNNFTYRNFDLSVYVFARYGQMIDAQFLGRYNPDGKGNGPAIINYWTPENPTNDFPRPMYGSTLTNYPGYQTLTFVDGSYFKIRNLSLGYTLPQKIAGKISASRLRIYATASNLLTITKSRFIKDYDPERGGAESWPLSREVVFGVNLDL